MTRFRLPVGEFTLAGFNYADKDNTTWYTYRKLGTQTDITTRLDQHYNFTFSG